MKYYSELTKKMYNSEKELVEAEEQVHQEEAEKEKQAVAISKEKKELAGVIDKAEVALDEAYKNLDLAREKAKDVQREALKKIEEILHPAEEQVKKAQARKLDAIKKFNEKYGVYTTTLTGAKAAEEMSRVWRAFDKFFDGFFF